MGFIIVKNSDTLSRMSLLGSQKLVSVLLTGSRGLIGSFLTQLLERSGFRVLKLDHRGTPEDDDCGTILSPDHIATKIRKCEGVIHLAAVSRVIWGEQNPRLCYLTNYVGTNNIIEAALSAPQKASQRPWIIYASSREVYGEQDILPVQETALLKPMNIYARTKVGAENLIHEAEKSGLRTSILRFSNVFGGSDDHKDRVIPAFCRAALNQSPLCLEGKSHTFDFTYVEDVVQGVLRAVQHLVHERTSLPPIHLTTGCGRTLEEVAYSIINQTKSHSQVIEKPPRKFDVSNFVGDPSRAKEILGWTPRYSFDQALRKYIKILKPQQESERGCNEDSESYSRVSANV